MLIELLETSGYRVRETPKGRYMRGVIPLLGGQYALDMLRNEALIRLFGHAQFRKGRAYTLQEFSPIANPQEKTAQFKTHVAQLAARSALFRGYRLACPTCDLETWYGLDGLAEMVVCQGCRTRFQLPLELDFAYRPNRLLMEALKSGALTILLTLYHWLHDSPITLWQSGLEIHKNGHTSDLDLLAQREDGLWLAECKDDFQLSDDEATQAVADQIRRGKTIASEIGARYVFATLYDGDLPDPIRSIVEAEDIELLPREALLYAQSPSGT